MTEYLKLMNGRRNSLAQDNAKSANHMQPSISIGHERSIRGTLLPALGLALMVVGCDGQEHSPNGTGSTIEFRRDFPVLEGSSDHLTAQAAEQLEFVAVSGVSLSGQENAVANPGETLRAFTLDLGGRLYVEEIESGQLYELVGPFLSWRYFSYLTWLDDDILAFDQWSNPHYGLHYEINFQERQLVSVSAITDVIEQ